MDVCTTVNHEKVSWLGFGIKQLYHVSKIMVILTLMSKFKILCLWEILNLRYREKDKNKEHRKDA